MSVLASEIAAYEAIRHELEAAHDKSWAVVHGGVLQGVFADFQDAAALAIDRYGSAPCLIRQIGANGPVQLPGGMMFTPSHAVSASRV